MTTGSKTHREDILRRKAGIDREKMREGANHQSRRHHEHDRNGELKRHESTAKMLAAETPARTSSTLGERVAQARARSGEGRYHPDEYRGEERGENSKGKRSPIETGIGESRDASRLEC